MDTKLHRPRRSRRRSASPESPTRVVRDRHYLRREEEFGAEEERRSRLTQEERMAEDGRKLQRRLEQDAAITILLQPSPAIHMKRAHCRANEYFITDASPGGDSLIMGDYRIALRRLDLNSTRMVIGGIAVGFTSLTNPTGGTPNSKKRKASTWRRETPQKYANRGSNEVVTKPGLKSLALVLAAEDGVSVFDSTANNV
ncbi:hypothetical protein V492_00134 [Pseudogymnoascus sp. VKM F-4246]|nr:hypothetical protein V492_00134 [Pseudogymnoascus sp. VKM F-4246]